MKPTAEMVRECYDYDPATGIFRHKRKTKGQIVQGAIAGTKDNYGYVKIGVIGRQRKAHHLAWLLCHGEWPDKHIDHVNGDPADNRIENLRLCERSQNQANRGVQSNNRLGLKGVGVTKHGRYRAVIYKRGEKQKYLGCFATPEEAHAAYVEAAKQIYGEFART